MFNNTRVEVGGGASSINMVNQLVAAEEDVESIGLIMTGIQSKRVESKLSGYHIREYNCSSSILTDYTIADAWRPYT
jgi:hypothetical protein